MTQNQNPYLTYLSKSVSDVYKRQLGGSLQQVSSYIFVLGPYNVDITGDLQNILGGSVPSVRVGY